MARQRPATRSTLSLVGQSVKFKGQIHSDEDLVVDGVIEGTISVPKHGLVIGANSRVNADVHAHSLVLHGELHGDVNVIERIEIKKTGSVQGNVITHRIVVEDGGMFRGSCETRRPDNKAPAKPAASKPAPVPVAARSAREAAQRGPSRPVAAAGGRK